MMSGLRRVYRCDQGAMCPNCVGKDKCQCYTVTPDHSPDEPLNKGTRQLYGGEEDVFRK